jgi:hypothetical protein
VTGAAKTDTRTQRNYGTGRDVDNNNASFPLKEKLFFPKKIFLPLDTVPFNG